MLIAGCRTSGELAASRADDDPTNVKTVEAPETQPSAAPTLENLQQELDIARGNLENTQAQAKQDKEKLEARITELETQNKSLQDEMAKLKTSAPAKPIAVDGALPNGKSGAPLLWELAANDLKAGRFDKAISPLEELVKTYPKDKLAFQALFQLGLTQYRLTRYSDSALTFNQVIDRFPKKKETALAWLGQASSFAQMKQLEDAKLIFEELAKRYPNSPEAATAKKIAKKKEKVPADLFPLAQSAHPALFQF